MRCPRCKGRKQMYKMRSIYSHTNTGGVEVDCPMCLGEGKVPDIIDDIIEKENKRKSAKKKRENGKEFTSDEN